MLLATCSVREATSQCAHARRIHCCRGGPIGLAQRARTASMEGSCEVLRAWLRMPQRNFVFSEYVSTYGLFVIAAAINQFPKKTSLTLSLTSKHRHPAPYAKHAEHASKPCTQPTPIQARSQRQFSQAYSQRKLGLTATVHSFQAHI